MWTKVLKIFLKLLPYLSSIGNFVFKQFKKNKMEERKGFLTPEQEKVLDELIELKGIAEALDGPAISLIDNQGLERLKEKLPVETLPVVYEVIDEIFKALEIIAKK